MNTVKKKVSDKDMANVEIALRRAAKKARVLAEQKHTPLVVYSAGQVVKKFPRKKRK